MDCKDVIRLVCEYLEGRLSTPVASAVRGHFSSCKNCSVVMEAAKRTLEIYFDRERSGPLAASAVKVSRVILICRSWSQKTSPCEDVSAISLPPL